MESTTSAEAAAFTRYDLGISPFWTEASPQEHAAQRAWQAEIATRGDVRFAEDVYVSPLAALYAERLHAGARTYIAAHVYVHGRHEIGEDCTLNPFVELKGRVRMGNGVRIGAHTSVLAFNHSMSPERPVFEQPLVFEGISIGDDVWIGSHVSILDGVTIGSHSVIGAGAVVTKDVAPWSIVGGNPARHIRDRREPRPTGKAAPASADLGARLEKLAATARAELPALLDRCWDPAGERYLDRPGADPTLRAWCDAVELSAMLAGAPPGHCGADRAIDVLRRGQDPRTGLVPEIGTDGAPGPVEPSPDGHAPVNYHILAAGYALELFGSRFTHPIHAIANLSARELTRALDALPWEREAWRAGSYVDSIGTALHRNRHDFGIQGEAEALFGWLLTRCDPATGLWGRRTPDSGWLEPVNGTYRATRGTFAQFGLPLPYPERTIDSVLAHAADQRWFRRDAGTACNVLDVIHPLWLAARQTGHRRAEGEAWARRQLERVLGSWRPGTGFSFGLEAGHGFERTPGLLGTEMWLSITWLLADHLGLADALGYRPLGVHRPEPAASLVS